MDLRDKQLGMLTDSNKKITKTITNDNNNEFKTLSLMSPQGIGNCILSLQSMDCEIEIVSRMLRKLCGYISNLTSSSISLDAQAVASILIG